MVFVIPVRKRWGQHFLASQSAAERIVAAARIGPGDTVIEVGPGDGALTRPLAARAGRLLAIEIDPLRAEALARELAPDPRVRMERGDALEKTFGAWLAGAGFDPPAVLVANLPYNAATPILTGAFEEPESIARIVATVQREVARRFVAKPGSEHYGFLSVRTAAFAAGRVLFDLPPGVFRPRPKVISSVLELTPRAAPLEVERRRRALALASLAFRTRRKTVPNALSSAAPREVWESALRESAETPVSAPRSSRSTTSSPSRTSSHDFGLWTLDFGRPVMTSAVEVVPLGGLGEFGKNVLWLKCGESSVLVDVGVSFADEAFPGIDKIAPDLSVLRGERIDAVLLTHGHEDHIGALPLLRQWCEAPVYGFPFTLALARRRLEETEASTDRLVIAKERAWNRAGEFSFAYFRISHSVPDSAAIVIEAGGRRLFHSGDFKLDDDPPDGERTDREGIAEAVVRRYRPRVRRLDQRGARRPLPFGTGCRARASRPLLRRAAGGLILTTFSSHVARVSQATEAALHLGRRVAFLGRSMRTVAEIAERFGRLRLPAGARPAPDELTQVPANRLLCLASGSQGEPFSALSRLAQDEHPDLKIEPGDLVLFSSRTIPGHERSVGRVTDHLVRRGARVLADREPPIHVSGHGHREDIAELLALVKPGAVVPVHGERRMLAAAAGVALESGLAPDAVHLLDNGDRLVLSRPGSPSSPPP